MIMKTSYLFDPDTGELYEKNMYRGPYLTERVTYGTLRLGPLSYVKVTVSEGLDAEREMFNHFGDDSSWPDGWYSRLMDGKISRKTFLPSELIGPRLGSGPWL